MPFDVKAATRFFFDKAAVRNAVDAGTRRALSKFGAFVRRRDRSSIRKRKKTSAPGKPPSSHSGELRNLLYFAYDAANKSVVIGPVPFRKGEAPALLEYGGTVVRSTKTGPKLFTYRPRPHTGPAFKAELPKAPQMFRDAIK